MGGKGSPKWGEHGVAIEGAELGAEATEGAETCRDAINAAEMCRNANRVAEFVLVMSADMSKKIARLNAN